MMALGMSRNRLAGFLRSEGLLVLAVGWLIGTAAGVTVAWMLVVLLAGVFDPPPEHLSIPWPYLGLILGMAAASTGIAIWFAERSVSRTPVLMLRERM